MKAIKQPVQKHIQGVDLSHLSQRQRLFVERWVICRNYTQAAKEAGYSSPNSASYTLVNNPKVKKVLEALERVFDKKLSLSIQMAQEKLLQSLNRNYHDMIDLLPALAKIPPQCFAYVDGLKVKPIYDLVKQEDGSYKKIKVDEEIEIKMMPNATAIDLAMKHLGGYAPVQQEQTVTIKWDQFTNPPDDADSVEKEIEGVEYEVKKLDGRSSNELEDEAFG